MIDYRREIEKGLENALNQNKRMNGKREEKKHIFVEFFAHKLTKNNFTA